MKKFFLYLLMVYPLLSFNGVGEEAHLLSIQTIKDTIAPAEFVRPEPADWFTGDIHVHRSCDGSQPVTITELQAMMRVNHLSVISVLGDMGNNKSADRIEDLNKVNEKDSPLSSDGQIIHYSAEWHWDATQWEHPHQALGGHLVLLGLKKAHKIWDESAYKVLDYAGAQNAVRGFAHMQYLNNAIQKDLDCCIPIDYPVEAALGNIEFVAEEQTGGSENGILAYYRLLNCGFRLALAGGTDYPCNNVPLGSVMTYVQIPGKKLTYQNWIEGIRKGRTVVSRNAHNEFIDLKVNQTGGPGTDIRLKADSAITIEAGWSAVEEMTGRIELVCNGKVIASKSGTAKPGSPLLIRATQRIPASSWISARRMDASGRVHFLHTSPAYVTVNDRPVRTSAGDAQYFVAWIDNILNQIEPGGAWNRYFPTELEAAKKRYRKARDIYSTIAAEAVSITNRKQ